jgi:hypothetical protein
LCDLIERNLADIIAALDTHSLVEIDWGAVSPVA